MKPIGYWLNRTDRAITHYMNNALAEFGLTRLAWQVLNVVRDGGDVADDAVHSILVANADTADLDTAISLVLTDGWVSRPAPAHLALTDHGRERLVEVGERINTFREVSLAGVTDDEYRTAVSVLERMTSNLEARA
ncbi:MarR family transcriptional regulator [Nocardia sp. SYP-A9097]|uniref:MarR family winged helix-turn-helix transcriptional regulator n=1 Tax=Nocardia sp. SYP-A9097 TaxID=2663237 RepID=UPI00129B8A6C|nr:MarR family transcriptional regulator [Nocardia sp. SYP-A9097]MRH89150.1 MarR family transcriptional regulator [Nocardia sp. SYP-A9097]